MWIGEGVPVPVAPCALALISVPWTYTHNGLRMLFNPAISSLMHTMDFEGDDWIRFLGFGSSPLLKIALEEEGFFLLRGNWRKKRTQPTMVRSMTNRAMRCVLKREFSLDGRMKLFWKHYWICDTHGSHGDTSNVVWKNKIEKWF